MTATYYTLKDYKIDLPNDRPFSDLIGHLTQAVAITKSKYSLAVDMQSCCDMIDVVID